MTRPPSATQPDRLDPGTVDAGRSAKAALRDELVARLRPVARPDHRHHWDLLEYIADFAGSAAATGLLVEDPRYVAASTVLVTPDNGLRRLRERVLRDGRRLLVPTCGIGRGFLLLDGSACSAEEAVLGSTMEAIDELARPVTLREIAAAARPDLLVTGALGVTAAGLRLGKGRGYFDLEWAMLREVGAVEADAPVAVLVHDVQVVDEELPVEVHDVVADLVVTPTRRIATGRTGARAARLERERITPEMLARTPPLRELLET
jgi:5-formyltetrahydrofolate cyclo-ligase